MSIFSSKSHNLDENIYRLIFKTSDTKLIWDNIKGYTGASIDPLGGIKINKSGFSKTKTNANELMNFDEVSSAINKFKTELQSAGTVTDDFFDDVDKSVTDYIKNTDAANLSAEGFYASQLKQTTGFMGVKEAIATYNRASENGIETQTAYAQAVGQTNTSLGKYLSGLNGANGSMKGYLGPRLS